MYTPFTVGVTPVTEAPVVPAVKPEPATGEAFQEYEYPGFPSDKFVMVSVAAPNKSSCEVIWKPNVLPAVTDTDCVPD